MKKQKIMINGERLKNTVEAFADFGRTKNNGVTRLALSDMDIKVRKHFCSLCEELGMTVTWDDMGNMYATLEGIANDQLPVVRGFNLDSGEKGGRVDVVVGVLTGVEVGRRMVESGIKRQEGVVIANIPIEEGPGFGPSLMAPGVFSGSFDN